MMLTVEQAAALPRNDTPSFLVVCDTDGDFEVPTYKVENRDEDGTPLGTYYDRTICRQ
jgi:hypothetical protein